jgi:hypothetical protein
VTVAQLMAIQEGADVDFVFDIQLQTLPIIEQYHKRYFMHDWMFT